MYKSSEVELKNVNAWYSVRFRILYYMDIKHEMGCSFSETAGLPSGRLENRGSTFNTAANFLRHTQNKLCHQSSALPKWNPGLIFWEQSARSVKLSVYLYTSLTLRMNGAFPPRRHIRRHIASIITLHLTWYLSGVGVSVLAFGTQVRGFKPGRKPSDFSG